MPELPDIEIYLTSLRERILGRRLERIDMRSPFVVRSVDPAIDTAEGATVDALRRLGKRIVMCLSGDLYMVIHLMIAGRFRWIATGGKTGGKIVLASFVFPNGVLLLTEAGSKKRAALHLVRGEAGLAEHDRGGLEVLGADEAAFRAVLMKENRTLKRALTDPRLFSGIGNAYSDEILHAARLSPVKLTQKLSDEEVSRLHRATVESLEHWVSVLADQFAGRFPGAGDITAFRDDFAAHGRFGKPCPACGAAIQRIRYADNETNYCPRCQTGGKLLADRSLSRLLKNDWPKSIDELDDR